MVYAHAVIYCQDDDNGYVESNQDDDNGYMESNSQPPLAPTNVKKSITRKRHRPRPAQTDRREQCPYREVENSENSDDDLHLYYKSKAEQSLIKESVQRARKRWKRMR